MDTANPYFFYETGSNEECLHRLEVSLRLGRGLNVVLGEVGTGKTTLANTLEQTLLQEEEFILGKLLDPAFSSEVQFLEALLRAFGVSYSSRASLDLKNDLKNFLFEKGVEEQKSVILVIDEGQKLSVENLETLRILLNYQAPQKKLLNIAIFAQPEVLEKIREKPNLADRIAFFHLLKPLTQEETFGLIDFRVRRAGKTESDFFTKEAKDLVYEYSKGRPRKIVAICHEAVQEMVIQEKSRVGGELIRAISKKKKEIDYLLFGTGAANKTDECFETDRETKERWRKALAEPISEPASAILITPTVKTVERPAATVTSSLPEDDTLHEQNRELNKETNRDDNSSLFKGFVKSMLKRLNII